MVLKEQVGWYEATLPLKERRSRGHFSTPPRLVERILDACGYTAGHDLTHIRVLDPACGSGNFLAEVARRLVSSAERTNLSPEELAALISRNIWGFDPDPISCFLAEMQLRSIHCLPTDLHIHQADGLTLPWDEEPNVDLFLANPPYLAAKNTDLSGYRSAQHGQTDSYLLFLNLGLQIVRPHGWLGLVLPDPLLARTNAARERAHLLKDFTIHHLWHLANVFAAQVGAVVIIAQKSPPPATHHISWEREKWRSYVETAYDSQLISTNGHELNEKGEAKTEYATHRGVGWVGLGGDPCGRPVIPFGQASPIPMGDHKGPPSAPLYPRPYAPTSSFFRLGDAINYPSTVPQSLFLAQPGAEFRYLLSTAPGCAIERLRAHFDQASASQRRLAPLSKFLTIRRGEELGMASPLLIREDIAPAPPQCTEQCGSESSGDERGEEVARGPLRSTVRRECDTDNYPILRGGRDIRPYATSFSGWRIARQAITKPLERYLSPKLLVVKSTDRLQAALDTGGHIVLQTLYLLHPRAKDTDLYFFLALLNSRLLQEYVYVLHTAYKWVQPQIEQHILAHLPIPIVNLQEKQQIIDRAKLLAQACSEIGPVVEWGEVLQSLYEEQELAISALYASALPGQAF